MKTEPLETGNKSFYRLIRTPRIVDTGKKQSQDGHRIIKERVTGFISLMQWWDWPSMSLQKNRSYIQLATNMEEQQEIASRGLGDFYIYTIACPFVICVCIACDPVPSRGPKAAVGWKTWQSTWERGSEERLLEVDQMALLVFDYDRPVSASFLCLKACSH